MHESLWGARRSAGTAGGQPRPGQGPDRARAAPQFQWWLVVFQPVALLACAAAHGCAHLQGLRPGARATLCVLTPLVMLQTDTVNAQRQARGPPARRACAAPAPHPR